MMALWIAGAAHSPGAGAGECTVPGTHATIQAALNEGGCNPVTLADASFAESLIIRRGLILQGAEGGATTIEGQVTIAGSAAQVDLRSLAVRSGCPDFTLAVQPGARVFSYTVTLGWSSALPCPPVSDILFSDSFENLAP